MDNRPDVNAEMQQMCRTVWGTDAPRKDYSAWRRLDLGGQHTAACCGCGKLRLLTWEHGTCYRDNWCRFAGHEDECYPCQVCDDCLLRIGKEEASQESAVESSHTDFMKAHGYLED
jgi:hypothetical protein